MKLLLLKLTNNYKFILYYKRVFHLLALENFDLTAFKNYYNNINSMYM